MKKKNREKEIIWYQNVSVYKSFLTLIASEVFCSVPVPSLAVIVFGLEDETEYMIVPSSTRLDPTAISNPKLLSKYSTEINSEVNLRRFRTKFSVNADDNDVNRCTPDIHMNLQCKMTQFSGLSTISLSEQEVSNLLGQRVDGEKDPQSRYRDGAQIVGQL